MKVGKSTKDESLHSRREFPRTTMVVLRILTLIATWCWVAAGVVGIAVGQRAPCYHCEVYRDTHPNSHPYTAVRAHCVYPCNCAPIPSCGPGTPIILDGCGCCWQCARQAGESCDGVSLCDSSRSLTCQYNNTSDATGICQEVFEAKCRVNDTIYEHGETFSLDCRTQCTCQNGTYACVSLCPGETILPSEQCLNPHLVSLPGQCCREWMCDAKPDKAMGPVVCERQSGRWSECSSASCGVGVSVRWSTDNDQCRSVNQTRLCQVRPCERPGQTQGLLAPKTEKPTRRHHIRRGHTCKATQRPIRPVRLRAGWCISEKRYRPKMCADCPGRCCKVHASTTISVAFLCPLHANKDLLTATKPHSQPRNNPNNYDVYDFNENGRGRSDFYDTGDGDKMSPESLYGDSVLKYPKPMRNFKELGPRYEYAGNLDDNYQRRVKKNVDYLEPFHVYPDNQNDDYYSRNDPNRSDNLLEDAPPFENDNLTLDDDIEFNQIKNDNYETVHHQVQWILRCKCQNSCQGQNVLQPRGEPSAPT